MNKHRWLSLILIVLVALSALGIAHSPSPVAQADDPGPTIEATVDYIDPTAVPSEGLPSTTADDNCNLWGGSGTCVYMGMNPGSGSWCQAPSEWQLGSTWDWWMWMPNGGLSGNYTGVTAGFVGCKDLSSCYGSFLDPWKWSNDNNATRGNFTCNAGVDAPGGYVDDDGAGTGLGQVRILIQWMQVCIWNGIMTNWDCEYYPNTPGIVTLGSYMKHAWCNRISWGGIKHQGRVTIHLVEMIQYGGSWEPRLDKNGRVVIFKYQTNTNTKTLVACDD